MPDVHVEFLLRKYRSYLEERMLDSGRLSKGTFNEIASDLNREFTVNHYEREQVSRKNNFDRKKTFLAEKTNLWEEKKFDRTKNFLGRKQILIEKKIFFGSKTKF